MKISAKLRALVATSAVAFGMLATSAAANASDCHQPTYHYKTIIVYKTVQQSLVTWVTRIDECHKPYRVKVVTYKTVKVPVEKRIRVAY